MTSTAELGPKLVPVVNKLVAQSNGAYDTEFIRDLVLRIAADFDDAPVQDFLALLVAKEAGDELRHLHALNKLAS